MRNEPCSKDVAFHYTFDFAQQFHYPSNPFQPGPIYFNTLQKCGIFGFHAEAEQEQCHAAVSVLANNHWLT